MDALMTGIFGLLILAAIFLVCRELVCWYWKINQAIEFLGEIKDAAQETARNTRVIAQAMGRREISQPNDIT